MTTRLEHDTQTLHSGGSVTYRVLLDDQWIGSTGNASAPTTVNDRRPPSGNRSRWTRNGNSHLRTSWTTPSEVSM